MWDWKRWNKYLRLLSSLFFYFFARILKLNPAKSSVFHARSSMQLRVSLSKKPPPTFLTSFLSLGAAAQLELSASREDLICLINLNLLCFPDGVFPETLILIRQARWFLAYPPTSRWTHLLVLPCIICKYDAGRLTLPARIANKYKQRQPLETARPQPHFGNIFSDAAEESGEGGCRFRRRGCS